MNDKRALTGQLRSQSFILLKNRISGRRRDEGGMKEERDGA